MIQNASEVSQMVFPCFRKKKQKEKKNLGNKILGKLVENSEYPRHMERGHPNFLPPSLTNILGKMFAPPKGDPVY